MALKLTGQILSLLKMLKCHMAIKPFGIFLSPPWSYNTPELCAGPKGLLTGLRFHTQAGTGPPTCSPSGLDITASQGPFLSLLNLPSNAT